MSLNEFFSMGGYAFYVWTAYGLTFLVFGINIMMAISEQRRVKKVVNHIINIPIKRAGAALSMQPSQLS